MPRVVYALCLCLAVCTLLAYGDEVSRLTFAQLVDSLKANLQVTQKIQSYNGKEVEIQGFIIPAGPRICRSFCCAASRPLATIAVSCLQARTRRCMSSRRKEQNSSTIRSASTRYVASLRLACTETPPTA